MDNLAEIADLEGAWRPLTPTENGRATYYLGAVSRYIRRRWKDVDQRIAAQTLGADDVKDVVVQLVLPKLEIAPLLNAKSWSQGAGPYSQQVALKTDTREMFELEDWMVSVFEGLSSSVALPVFHAPPPGRYEGLFIWPEGRD